MNPSDAVTREANPLAQLANEPAGSIAVMEPIHEPMPPDEVDGTSEDESPDPQDTTDEPPERHLGDFETEELMEEILNRAGEPDQKTAEELTEGETHTVNCMPAYSETACGRCW